MDLNIVFTFENVSYTVSHEAYDLGMIVLPDGRALMVDSWFESEPPTPKSIREIQHSYHDRPVVEIANMLDAVQAEVEKE